MSLLLLLNGTTPFDPLTGGAVRRVFAETWLRFWSAERLTRKLRAETATRNWIADEAMIYADPKDFEAIENFEIDWSQAVGSDTITASTWEVPDGITAVSTNHTDTTATIRLSGGAQGKRYILKNLVTLESGQIKTQPLIVPVC